MTRSLGGALTAAAARLAAAGSLSPRLDAEVLLAQVTGLSRGRLLAAPEGELTAAQATTFDALLARRLNGWPVAYLTGIREFYGLDFLVTPDVLIPRPETELLVETVLAEERDRSVRGVELGTGSGCIAVALAVHGFRLTATDRSTAALAVAKQNAARHGVADKIEFIESDWGDTILSPPRPPSEGEGRGEGGRVQVTGPYDFLVSNPPYIAEGEYAGLMPGVKREPKAALLGGPDGLDFYRRTLDFLPRLLIPGGRAYLELGTNAAAARTLFESAPGITNVRVLPDLAGWPRLLVLGRAQPS